MSVIQINEVSGGQTNNYHVGDGEQPTSFTISANILYVWYSVVVHQQDLAMLQPVDMNASELPECLEGTREEIIQSIEEWAAASDGPNVLWLHGVAGSGKSTISSTVANLFRHKKQLGAYLFFSRDKEYGSSSVVRTMAHKLAMFNRRIAGKILSIIENDPDIAHSPLHYQFSRLIVDPIISSFSATDEPIVIVVDALDECSDAKGRSMLLDVLAKHSFDIRQNTRILITSRPESDIKKEFEGKSHIVVQELNLDTASNRHDILHFLRGRLQTIHSKNTTLPLGLDWPGEDVICALAQQAQGLFIWASTACLFIDAHDPRNQLKVVLRSGRDFAAKSALDSIYATAMNVAGPWDDLDFRADCKAILGAIVVAKRPISDTVIDQLLCLEERPSEHTISKLRCVLQWTPWGFCSSLTCIICRLPI